MRRKLRNSTASLPMVLEGGKSKVKVPTSVVSPSWWPAPTYHAHTQWKEQKSSRGLFRALRSLMRTFTHPPSPIPPTPKLWWLGFHKHSNGGTEKQSEDRRSIAQHSPDKVCVQFWPLTRGIPGVAERILTVSEGLLLELRQQR